MSMLDPFDTSGSVLKQLRGVGEQSAARLRDLGITSVAGLLMWIPRRYENLRELASLSDASGHPGGKRLLVRVTVQSLKQVPTRRGLARTLTVHDGSHLCRVWFFKGMRPPADAEPGTEWLMLSTVKPGRTGLMASSARFIHPDKWDTLPSLEPVYPALGNLQQGTIRKLMTHAIDALDGHPLHEIPSQLDLEARTQAEILQSLHQPGSIEEATRARRELGIWELAKQFLKLAAADTVPLDPPALTTGPVADSEFFEALPFQPTADQFEAFQTLREELNRTRPMRRMIQGDVGSGKTLVAAYAAYLAGKGGMQVALLAPTEVLAMQQAQTVHDLLEPLGLPVQFLSGSLPKDARAMVQARIDQGEVDVVVGTHALFSDATAYPKLGLVIVDEQHKFGVAQQDQLLGKGHNPHLLVMTATPLPRTQTLMQFSGLDVSYLNTAIRKAEHVRTRIVYESRLHETFDYVAERAEAGERCFLISPYIDHPDVEPSLTVEGLRGAFLAHTRWPTDRVGLLHGRMDMAEKKHVITAFREGQAPVLAATTVVEIGVNVPDAALIVIVLAQRLGLTQLHQLRGRVGRQGQKAACILVVPTHLDDVALARLRAFKEAQDGFALAEADWNLRGPGMLDGALQSGWTHIPEEIWKDRPLVERVAETTSRLSPPKQA